MTYQVVAVGSDGIIIGSDRKLSNRPPNNPDNPPFPQFDIQRKFVTDHDKSLICAWSGEFDIQILNATMEKMEEALGLSSFEWLIRLDAIAKEIPVNGLYHRLIVVRPNNLDHAILMSPPFHAKRIETRQTTGVNSSACFFTNNYYENKPVMELTRLVLLTLDRGAIEFPTTVGDGYDLALITKAGVEWKTYDSNDEIVVNIRQSFNRATLGVIYPSNS